LTALVDGAKNPISGVVAFLLVRHTTCMAALAKTPYSWYIELFV
jgi:hypothetical protein